MYILAFISKLKVFTSDITSRLPKRKSYMENTLELHGLYKSTICRGKYNYSNTGNLLKD